MKNEIIEASRVIKKVQNGYMVNNGKNIFKKYCEEQFGFLARDYNFIIAQSKKNAFGNFIIFKNETTGVEISFEPREGGVFVRLIQLVDGKIPEYPLFLDSPTAKYTFDLDIIILFKKLQEIERPLVEELFKPKKFQEILSQNANILKNYCNNILRGDFSEFPKIYNFLKTIRRSK